MKMDQQLKRKLERHPRIRKEIFDLQSYIFDFVVDGIVIIRLYPWIIHGIIFMKNHTMN